MEQSVFLETGLVKSVAFWTLPYSFITLPGPLGILGKWLKTNLSKDELVKIYYFYLLYLLRVYLFLSSLYTQLRCSNSQPQNQDKSCMLH